MVKLVLLLQAAQDRDRILDRRLGDEDGLEPPRQRRVLLHMLAVLVQRGRTDAVKLAARQGRLQHVGRVHRAIGLAGPDQGVHLVDEDDDLAGRRRDLLKHGLQPLLELAAILGARHHGAEVERHQALVLQAFRHVALDDALGQTFHDGGLADAGLADQDGVVLGAPGQNLDGAPDFLVTADHRVELAFARRFGQVAGVLLQGVVALLGRSAVGGAALADRVDRLIERLRRDARVLQDTGRGRAFRHGERQQQAFSRDEAVAGLGREVFRRLEQARQFGRQIDLAGAGPFDLRLLVQFRFDGQKRPRRVAARRFDQVGGQPFLVFQQGRKQMFRRQPLMSTPESEALCGLYEAA